ncbi:MAG: hypothetical protein HRU38_13505 [Saccharospirillaceae bacterium]|nr:hypothetical protein [Pseudomonadales bacterium]NRB79660.1 hypothetical protein [Saccharospirillaceae bacterium]
MSENNHLRNTVKSVSSLAGFKWIELTFKILKRNFWSFLSFAILTILVNIVLTFSLSLIGLFISFCIYIFFCASISMNSQKINNSTPLPLKDFFNFNRTNTKQLILSSVIYCALFLIIIIIAMVPSVEIFNFSPEQLTALQQMEFQDQIKYFEAMFIESPDKYSKVLTSSLILCIGFLLLESIMFFVPTLLALNPSLNVFSAIKLSMLGLFNNLPAFIVYGLILTPIILLSVFFSIFGFALFLLILKISTFIAYQEIFTENNPISSDDNKPNEHTTSDNLDSRDF